MRKILLLLVFVMFATILSAQTFPAKNKYQYPLAPGYDVFMSHYGDSLMFWVDKTNSWNIYTDVPEINIPRLNIGSTINYADSVDTWLKPIVGFTDSIPAYADSLNNYIARSNVSGTPKSFRKNTYYTWNGSGWDSIVPINGHGVINNYDGAIYVYYAGAWRKQGIVYYITPNRLAVKGYYKFNDVGTRQLTVSSGQVVLCGSILGNEIFKLPAIGTSSVQAGYGMDFVFLPIEPIEDSSNTVIIQTSTGTAIDTIKAESEWIHVYATPDGWKHQLFGRAISVSHPMTAKTNFVEPTDTTLGINSDSIYYLKGDTLITSWLEPTYNTQNLWIGERNSSIAGANTWIGYKAGRNITIGDGNTAIGYESGMSLTSGAHNFISGYQALNSITDGNFNIAIGLRAGQQLSLSSNNILLGRQAGYGASSGNLTSSICIGNYTAVNSLSSSDNIFIGNSAGELDSASSSNIFIGTEAGKSNKTGFLNIAIGAGAGNTEIVGAENIMIGGNATISGAGEGNIALGSSSDCGDGNYSVVIGCEGAISAVGLEETILIGKSAGSFMKRTNTNSVFIGSGSGGWCDSSAASILIGANTGTLLSGTNNIAIGANAFGSDTSVFSLAIGSSAGIKNKGDSSIFIGAFSGTRIGFSNTKDRAIYIGRGDSTQVAIYGIAPKVNGKEGYLKFNTDAIVQGRSAFTPSDTIKIDTTSMSIAASQMIYKVMYVMGNQGEVDTVSIANGTYDGQEIEFIGLDDTKYVHFASSGNMLVNAGTGFNLLDNYIIGFRWSAKKGKWLERYRSAN